MLVPKRQLRALENHIQCMCGGNLVELENQMRVSLGAICDNDITSVIANVYPSGLFTCEDCRLTYFLPEKIK